MLFKIEYHPYVAEKADPIVEFCQKHGIVVSSYGGLSSVIRKKDGPVVPVVEAIRARIEKEVGPSVTATQVVLKWINQKGIHLGASSQRKRLGIPVKDWLNCTRTARSRCEAVKSGIVHAAPTAISPTFHIEQLAVAARDVHVR
jgi:hypothetical protein